MGVSKNDFCAWRLFAYCVGAIVPLVGESSESSLMWGSGCYVYAGWLGGPDLKTCDVNVPLHSRSHRNLHSRLRLGPSFVRV